MEALNSSNDVNQALHAQAKDAYRILLEMNERFTDGKTLTIQERSELLNNDTFVWKTMHLFNGEYEATLSDRIVKRKNIWAKKALLTTSFTVAAVAAVALVVAAIAICTTIGLPLSGLASAAIIIPMSLVFGALGAISAICGIEAVKNGRGAVKAYKKVMNTKDILEKRENIRKNLEDLMFSYIKPSVDDAAQKNLFLQIMKESDAETVEREIEPDVEGMDFSISLEEAYKDLTSEQRSVIIDDLSGLMKADFIEKFAAAKLQAAQGNTGE